MGIPEEWHVRVMEAFMKVGHGETPTHTIANILHELAIRADEEGTSTRLFELIGNRRVCRICNHIFPWQSSYTDSHRSMHSRQVIAVIGGVDLTTFKVSWEYSRTPTPDEVRRTRRQLQQQFDLASAMSGKRRDTF